MYLDQNDEYYEKLKNSIPLTAPYLILVCFTKSSAPLIALIRNYFNCMNSIKLLKLT
jgi:hypothetical protein